MSEYTPTTETLGHGSIKLTYYPSSDRIGVEQTGVNSVMDSWELVRFVRELGLLAAHDAEVRAGVVAEEPEWEVGVSYSTPTGPSVDGYRMRSYIKVESVEKAREFAALVDRPMIQKRTKAVPAGEWVSVPVKQEGAETDA